MGACVSNAGPSSRSPSLPRSSLQSANPQSPDLLCHGIQTRTASDSQSQTSSTQRADLGLLSGTTRSSISADIEQPLAVREQQSKQLRPSSAGSSCPTAVTAADDSTSHSASARTKPPPLTAPIAVYRMRDDEDDDDDEEEEEEEEDEEEEGKFDELELITEEQVFAAAHDSFDDDQSLNAAPMNARRMSLLASAPPGSSISSSLSLGDSPLSASMERRLTVTVSVGSFHVLLVDEDEQHAALIARWLRKKQFVVTVCADGEEAVSLMQEVHEASRARNAMQPSDAGSSRHSVSCLDPSQLHDIDLIISDTCMTGSDGQPFLDFCKHSPAFAHIPLVLMSVDVESAAVNRSINRGAYDHWTKPLARPLLQNTVRVIREGQKEARKASLLREWGDRYKQTMIEERRAAIGQGHQPHTLSATPLTAMRSAMLLTPLAPSARSLPPINGATGGWSAAAQYGQLMAQEGRTFAVVLNAAQEEEEQLELERLREWMRELHVEHSVVSSVSDVSKRVERMTKSSADMLVPLGRKRGKSWQSSTYQIPLPVARIQEEEREQESDAAASLRRRDEVNAMRVKGIIGLMKQRSHSRSKTNCELAEQFADRDVDLLVVDVDGLDAEALKECHAMLERATQKAVSIIGDSTARQDRAELSHTAIASLMSAVRCACWLQLCPIHPPLWSCPRASTSTPYSRSQCGKRSHAQSDCTSSRTRLTRSRCHHSAVLTAVCLLALSAVWVCPGRADVLYKGVRHHRPPASSAALQRAGTARRGLQGHGTQDPHEARLAARPARQRQQLSVAAVQDGIDGSGHIRRAVAARGRRGERPSAEWVAAGREGERREAPSAAGARAQPAAGEAAGRRGAEGEQRPDGQHAHAALPLARVGSEAAAAANQLARGQRAAPPAATGR